MTLHQNPSPSYYLSHITNILILFLILKFKIKYKNYNNYNKTLMSYYISIDSKYPLELSVKIRGIV